MTSIDLAGDSKSCVVASSSKVVGAGFTRVAGSSGPGFLWSTPAGAEEIAADIAIVRAGSAGARRLWPRSRSGRTVVMTEPTDWIGGQLTQQAVPPDEHPWIEQFGGNASYFALRRGIRDYYQGHYPSRPRPARALPELLATAAFRGSVTNAESRLAVLTEMLARTPPAASCPCSWSTNRSGRDRRRPRPRRHGASPQVRGRAGAGRPLHPRRHRSWATSSRWPASSS